MKNNRLLYPLKFTPILKEKVWGGNKLKELYNKSKGGNVGESWEISGVENNISVVENGSLKGKQLVQIIREFKGDVLGSNVYKTFGNSFPLLFKFIDAHKDLSVQLHPNDALAKARHNSFGKTEMWYILDSEKSGKLVLGFNSKINEDSYNKHLSENALSEILHTENVEKGDAFIIKTGTVHAIGAGVVLAEIQQTSDITYRIFDYNRPGINGELRELHTDLALEAIDFNASKAKLEYSKKINEPVQVCKTEYFITSIIELSKGIDRDLNTINSFVVYMCVAGEGEIQVHSNSEKFKMGDTLLIPAIANQVKINTTSATFLEIYIP